ncbi:MAG: AbrB/MazE/SpoVT family DNA-binding domain-containing protein [Kiritimatiellae bacterium]|nr:AbrB/MazE/SpoVT family DNA-binding domain-containing protein [Kiritimatiellia bacterium]
MDTVTVSPKYQVVIPRPVRERLRISPGEQMQVIGFDDRIEMVTLRPIKNTRGFLRKYDRSFRREKADRE